LKTLGYSIRNTLKKDNQDQQIKMEMKKVNVLIILLSLFCFCGIQAQTIDWNSIVLSNSTSVSGKINGFNMGGYAYGRINNQSNNITVPSECNQCGTSLPLMSGASYSSMQTKPNVINETAKLNPGVLRFPGGTHSGWYHLYEYDNQGFYDAASPQIKKGYGMTVIEAGHLNNPLGYCRQDSRITVNQNFIDGFVNYVQNIQNTTANSNKIEVTYVVNLLTHFRFLASQTIYSSCGRAKTVTPMDVYDCTSQFTYSYVGNEALFNNDPNIYRFELYYKETQDAIDKIVNDLALNANDVLYVEMGNEYYSTAGYPYSKYQMDINDYSQLVEIYSERLKCYFSNKVDLKTGVVTKPGTAWQTGLIANLNNDLNGNGETLNEQIDAVIYHDYYTNSICLNETDIDTRFNCAKDAFRNHIEIELVTNLNILQNDFPDQKVWITEWNMLKGTDDKNNSYINTILHASFVQEYALSMLEYNATHNNAVSMLAHHRLGDHNLWSVIQTQDGSNTEANFRSGAHAMQHIGKLYDHDNINILGNILTDGTTTFDTKEAKVLSFLQYKDGNNSSNKLLLYFSNKTNTDIGYTIPTFIDSVYVDSAKISFLNGNHLFTYGPRNTTAGRNRFKETANLTHHNDELDNLGYGVIDNQFNSTLESPLNINALNSLPSNSIGIIEIYLEDFAVNVVESEQLALNINLFPNPASESINLSFTSKISGEFQLQLFSNLGQEVLNFPTKVQIGENSINIDSNNLIDGLYLLTIENDGMMGTKKVIINRN